jgi:alkylation response protein AidB-like acyl-CoA dehydrogenase
VSAPEAGITAPSTHATEWLRAHVLDASALPLPGDGATLRRWQWFAAVARDDLSRARLAEGHADALAILVELGRADLVAPGTWGVWAAEPTKLRAVPTEDGRWWIVGEKRWCSGSTALDHALVVATAPDGPRLFAVEPSSLERVPGSWQPIGMEATVSETIRFDVVVDADRAVAGPDAYVARAGFWHGAIGVAACWYGGALGIAERLWTMDVDADGVAAARGRVRSQLAAVRDHLDALAHSLDARPASVDRVHALTARLMVEACARAVLDDVTVRAGAGALAFDRAHAQRVADLTLYLRQLHRDRDEVELGRAGDGPGRW